MKLTDYNAMSKILGQASQILECIPSQTWDCFQQPAVTWQLQAMEHLSSIYTPALDNSVAKGLSEFMEKSAPMALDSSMSIAISESMAGFTPFVLDDWVPKGISEAMTNFHSVFLDNPAARSIQDSFGMISDIATSIPSLTEQIRPEQDRYLRFSQNLMDSLDRVLERSRAWVLSEEPEECEHSVSPAPAQKAASLITFDRALALLSLLISLLAFLVTLQPNTQLDEQIEQNERIIAIQEEQLELERQNTQELQELTQDLSELIVELHGQIQAQSQQIEALREQLQDTGELPETPTHSAQPNGLNQNADTQD